MAAKLLVTGGAGYIGSHTLVELLTAGYRPLVLDNFSNSSAESLKRVGRIAGAEVEYLVGDVRDYPLLMRIFEAQEKAGSPVTGVIHFAANKAISESLEHPCQYYDNNVCGTITLLRAMAAAGVKRIVFSSSATVYGAPQRLPLAESHPIAPANPYGQTKAMVEQILHDVCRSRDDFTAICLRYFNPIGAHVSGLIGEDPRGIPNNLVPFITQVAIGRLPHLNVFGNDYPTVDGTGVRDFIHVTDLAQGHVKAMAYAEHLSRGEFRAINLGTGRGTSVLEMVHAMERACGKAIPYEIRARRPGDLAEAWADPSLAQRLLGWTASRDVAEMCRDGWNWQRCNPDGYREH